MSKRRLLAFAILATLASSACRGRTSATASSEVPADARARTHRERFGEMTLNLVELGPTNAPLLIVIHGGPGLDHTYLRPWLDSLADRHHLVYVDLRGHGRSDPPADANGYTISAAAADLHRMIQAIGHGAPADVLAHDFGGAIGVELAVSHGESVRRLILVDPYRDPSQIRAMPTRSREVLGDAGYGRVLDLTTPQGTLRDPHATVELFRRLGHMWFHRMPSEAVLERLGRDLDYHSAADEHFLLDGAGWSALQGASEVRAPTLVISGDDDRTFTADESRVLADMLPHGQFAAIPESGHLPFVEQPARFRDTVEAFLRSEPRAQ